MNTAKFLNHSINVHHHIHFIGIAGTATGSVAAELKRMGFNITGSDEQVYPPMSDILEQENIDYFNGFHKSHLRPQPEIVVVGNAISRGNPELEAALKKNIPIVSLPNLISNFFICGKESIVVTGTHGKSTATALLAWIFERAGKNPGYLIGGIPLNLKRSCAGGKGGVFIVEGDEYDTAFFDKHSKFLHYSPKILVINNIEYDHVDIFADLAAMIKEYYNVINIVPPSGYIIANFDDNTVRQLVTEHPVVRQKLVRVISFGTHEGANWQISNVRHKNGNVRFGLIRRNFNPIFLVTRLSGDFQVYNISAAAITALECGISLNAVKEAVQTFRGLRRRMDIYETASGVTLIDDFAHHPTAIKATILGAKKRYRNKKIWVVVEPRSNSMRRNVFQEQLAEALMAADNIVLAGVDRPEKVPEHERLLPHKVIEDLKKSGKIAEYIRDVDDIVKYIQKNARPDDIVIGMSNGGFGNFHQKTIEAFS